MNIKESFPSKFLKTEDLRSQSITLTIDCVEKDPPHGIMVWELDTVALEQGRREYQSDLEVYAKCQSMNHWPGYPIDVQTISLPDWYLVHEKLAAA